jgi:phosphatidate cytidylyltransferase
MASRERLFDFHHAFDSPVILWIAIGVTATLIVAALIIWLLHVTGRTSPTLNDELVKRVVSWAVMVPLLLGPVLLGAAWTILGVGILSVLCYREFARAIGFFRQRCSA